MISYKIKIMISFFKIYIELIIRYFIFFLLEFFILKLNYKDNLKFKINHISLLILSNFCNI